MPGYLPSFLRRRLVRRIGLAVAGVSALAVAAWCGRGLLVHQATAQPAPVASIPAAAAAVEPTPASSGDYLSRVVAYVHNGHAITRQDLGEFLIHRHGAERLPLLLNKRIVDDECARHGLVITAAEVDAALAEELKGLAIDQATFLKTVLARAKKNLYEWKEDVLRPRLQMTRLVGPRLHVAQEDLRKAFESSYGEKVECRMILWPLDQEKQALDEFARLRDSEAAFAEKARTQATSQLAAAGGKIKPIGRHAMDEKIEKEAFALQPGQVSTLLKTPQGILMLKCDRRLPADTTVNFDSVKEKLEKEFREQKLQGEMAKSFQALRDQAKPQLVLQKADRLPAGPVSSPTAAVAYLYGSKPVTREELGEFLIARMGADKLEFLVNRRIIDLECAERKVAVSDAEVDKALEDDLKMLNCDRKHFEKEVLSKWGKNLFEYREDVVRPKLMLTRLCQGRVKVTDEDVQKGFEAYYGERLECRLILWPTEQARFALTEYAKIRDSEEEFDRKAKSQASASLAAQGGKIPPFGRHTLGDETLEREAFRLQPGEISTLIGTAQGQVVIRCDRRIPPDKGVKLEQVRDKLATEVRERKVQMEMQMVFRELKEKATPRLILQGTNQVEDLAAESKRLLSEAQAIQGRLPNK